MDQRTTSEAQAKPGWGSIAAAMLLAANVVVPLAFGDVYPFTSAPMFRDRPTECCNYRVFDPAGQELPAEDWLCHRIYDGNPIGYGVGLAPPAVLEQEFGHVHDDRQIREHVARLLHETRHAGLDYVDVQQDVVGPVDAQRVGIVRTTKIRVSRERPADAGSVGH